jgi:quinol monooxygenase YgiN
MAELAGSAKTEAGTRVYEWALSDNDTMAHIHERYSDSAATLAHLAMFRETFAHRFLAAVEPVRLVVYGTPSEQSRKPSKGPVLCT